MNSLLLGLFLSIAVGDQEYDPTIEIHIAPIGSKQAACVATTGWWIVTEVEISSAGEELPSASKAINIVHAIFSVFEFDWDPYYDQEMSRGQKSLECQELFDEYANESLTWLNLCADFTKHPELFTKVCR